MRILETLKIFKKNPKKTTCTGLEVSAEKQKQNSSARKSGLFDVDWSDDCVDINYQLMERTI